MSVEIVTMVCAGIATVITVRSLLKGSPKTKRQYTGGRVRPHVPGQADSSDGFIGIIDSDASSHHSGGGGHHGGDHSGGGDHGGGDHNGCSSGHGCGGHH